MENLMQGTAPLEFGEEGFLNDPKRWNRELAEQIAGEDGIGRLSDAHWAVIQQLRDHYLGYGAIVPASHACRVNKLDPGCVTSLFHDMREAWRIAGLPNPGAEATSYM